MTRDQRAEFKAEMTDRQRRQWAEWLRNTINALVSVDGMEVSNAQGEGDAPLSGIDLETYVHASVRLEIATNEMFRARKDLEHILARIEANDD